MSIIDVQVSPYHCLAITCPQIQYNTIRKFALRNLQTNCQFNLARKVKRTEMFFFEKK